MSTAAGIAWIAFAIIIGGIIAHLVAAPKRRREEEDSILDAADEIRSRRLNDRGWP
jgi:hypothetical protein